MGRLTRALAAGAVAALFVGLIAAGSAQAQTSATASATASATVVGIAPLTATTLNDLDFGSVNAGASGTVADVDGARFLITGEPGLGVDVSFVLPGTLVGPAAATIPISFGPTDGCLWAPFPASCTVIDPTAPTLALALDGSGLLEIGVIGTVTPPAATVSGIYTGTITVNVAY
ncbi:MAG TPA: DUF4402 domain-containing protein [Gemmatimonadales bacterium]